MHISEVAPELRKPVRRLPRMPFASTWGRWLIRTTLRLLPAASLDGVRLELVDAGQGLRVFHPPVPKSAAALLWIHGGGFVIGRAAQDDRFCAETAKQLGIVVVSTNYRLAPEHPFPAPLDDCLAGWEWLQHSATRLGIDAGRIAIGGQSAGAALAATLIQKIHDAGGNKAVAQWLFCPMLDDRTAARRELDATNHFLWTNKNNFTAWRAYLGAPPGAAQLPPYAAAARREDLHGLPPAWIGVGEIDLFLAEDREYAARLRAAGIDVTLKSVPGAPHGFEAWAPATPLAASFVAEARSWLGAVTDRAASK